MAMYHSDKRALSRADAVDAVGSHETSSLELVNLGSGIFLVHIYVLGISKLITTHFAVKNLWHGIWLPNCRAMTFAGVMFWLPLVVSSLRVGRVLSCAVPLLTTTSQPHLKAL